MDFRLFTALLVGKIISNVLKLKGSGATAAPGLIALKIDNQLIEKLAKKLSSGSIIVTGTNGKTTTSRLIFDSLKSDYKIIHNRQGSNLLRGIASTLIKDSSLFGKLNYDLGLWETDEAVAKSAIEKLNPKVILFLNLFRDQLDRYGEVDSVRSLWQKAVSACSKNSVLILNADDPGVYSLKNSSKAKTVSFGLDNSSDLNQPPSIKSDVKHCPECSSKLSYKESYSSHLGIYACTKCSFKRDTPHIRAAEISIKDDFKSSYVLVDKGKSYKIKSDLPGIYNIYNQVAAASVLSVLGKNLNTFQNYLKKFNPAFGRYQSIKIDNKKIVIFLIKNPTGANEVLRMLADKKNLDILAILNDKLADGKDVSWIWDTNWESLGTIKRSITISGIRAKDLAVRLKYAGIGMNKFNIHENIKYSFEAAIQSMNKNNTLIILPTYTALLSVQKILSQKGLRSWQKQ